MRNLIKSGDTIEYPLVAIRKLDRCWYHPFVKQNYLQGINFSCRQSASYEALYKKEMGIKANVLLRIVSSIIGDFFASRNPVI